MTCTRALACAASAHRAQSVYTEVRTHELRVCTELALSSELAQRVVLQGPGCKPAALSGCSQHNEFGAHCTECGAHSTELMVGAHYLLGACAGRMGVQVDLSPAGLIQFAIERRQQQACGGAGEDWENFKARHSMGEGELQGQAQSGMGMGAGALCKHCSKHRAVKGEETKGGEDWENLEASQIWGWQSLEGTKGRGMAEFEGQAQSGVGLVRWVDTFVHMLTHMSAPFC
eukprot:1152872-Pelagomonas_calceolata.AAC.11